MQGSRRERFVGGIRNVEGTLFFSTANRRIADEPDWREYETFLRSSLKVLAFSRFFFLIFALGALFHSRFLAFFLHSDTVFPSSSVLSSSFYTFTLLCFCQVLTGRPYLRSSDVTWRPRVGSPPFSATLLPSITAVSDVTHPGTRLCSVLFPCPSCLTVLTAYRSVPPPCCFEP